MNFWGAQRKSLQIPMVSVNTLAAKLRNGGFRPAEYGVYTVQVSNQPWNVLKLMESRDRRFGTPSLSIVLHNEAIWQNLTQEQIAQIIQGDTLSAWEDLYSKKSDSNWYSDILCHQLMRGIYNPAQSNETRLDLNNALLAIFATRADEHEVQIHSQDLVVPSFPVEKLVAAMPEISYRTAVAL
jgi:hypothetical protein